MRSMLLAILLNGIFLYSFGQKETAQWFLNNNRISITPSGITNLVSPGNNSGFNPIYGSTSVSDAAGNLLFACDGRTIINKNLSVMPALKDVFLQANSDKILPVNIPGSSKYYVFYASANAYDRNAAWTLKYAIVDLSLDGGLGDVIVNNQVIASDLSQGFTLAQGAGTDEVWLVTHRNATNNFLTYKISSAGLSKTPVISKAGSNPIAIEYIFKDLKTSHNGKMIAGIAYRDYTVDFARAYRFLEVFNFDANSGTLTNKVRTTRSFEYFYFSQTLEFSSDNRLIYVGSMQRIYGLQPCGWGGGSVIQYNVCYTDSTDFTRYSMYVASEYNRCGSYSSWARIQMASDKRIYMPHSGTTISSISNPNRIGSFSNYTYSAFELPIGNGSTVATPTFHQGLLQKAVENNIVYEGGCFPNPITFNVTNSKISSISWNFGDAASSSNTSNAATPQHAFSAPGIYTVTARLYNADGLQIETLTEVVEIKDPSKRLLAGYPKDTIFCSGNSLKIKLQVVNGIFHWTQKSIYETTYHLMTADNIDITSSGTYYVEMRQNDCNGCIQRDSIKVIVLPTPYLDLGFDKMLCTGDSLQVSVNDPSASYIWSTGDTTTSIQVRQGGSYWVQGEFNHNGCPQRDTIVINKVPGVSFNFPNDTVLCSGQSLQLNPAVANAMYLWQNGNTQSTFLVQQPGTYWASVTDPNGCYRTDTIHVSYINAQQVSLGRDTALCQGDSLVLKTEIANAKCTWSTGATTRSIVVKKEGIYWVRVNNGSCTVADTINVRFSSPPHFSLGKDLSLCEAEKQVLKSSVTGADYIWQNGSSADSFIVQQPGLYWLQVKKEGCLVRDSIQVTYKPLPRINLGSDTAVCTGSTVMLDAYNPSVNSYAWQNNTALPGFVVKNPGTYWVNVIGANGCKNADTIKVAEKPLPAFSLGSDTSLCEGQLLKYHFNLHNAVYQWSDASVFNSFSIARRGTYWLQITQNGCSKRDSISVNYKPLPVVNLGRDTLLCEGATKLLNAYSNTATYKWNTGVTSPSLRVNQSGNYWVAVTLDGCVRKDTVLITYTDLPHVALGKDTVLCKGQSFVLDPRVTTGRFLWQDGSAASKYTVTHPGIYTVKISNDCGSANSKIVVEEGACELFMPNAFTANRDGLNDVFGVKYPQFIKVFKMQVLNRWGQIVYSSTDPYKGWNGRYHNAEVPIGNYIWIIDLTDLNGKRQTYKGNVLLIR